MSAFLGQGLPESLLGIPVIESRTVQPHQLLLMADERGRRAQVLYVHSMWEDLTLPMLLAEMRKSYRAFLAELVAATEVRLFGGVQA